MNPNEDYLYRLRVAIEFRDRAVRNFAQNDWSGCVQQAQIAVENAAKAILAYVGPVPHTHEPYSHLEVLLAARPDLPPDVIAAINAVIAACRHLGAREHVLTTYGDEGRHLTPSQIFHQPEATAALHHARNAISNAEQVIHDFLQSSDNQCIENAGS